LPFGGVLEQVSESLNRPEMRGHTTKPLISFSFRPSVRFFTNRALTPMSLVPEDFGAATQVLAGRELTALRIPRGSVPSPL
jgi:hypothetical protein